MATERVIKKKGLEILRADGWVAWCPAKVRYQETDVWTIFDCVCVRGFGEFKFIQWTSKSNMRARQRKIEDFFRRENVFIPDAEVWGYDDKTHEFRIIPILPLGTESKA